ncbi:MAG: hypothetical protein ABIN67_14010 [Ferruginibacter sp.]
MDLNYQQKIPADFNDASKVWIYQSTRLFETSEAQQIEKMLSEFIDGWKSHGDTVKGYADLVFDQFIVLMADETATGVSGCSTDSSVRIIKEIEQQFNVQLFDRQTLAFVLKDNVQLLPFAQLNHAIGSNFVNADTLYFNNTVLTKKEFLQNWIIPIKESWLAKRINLKELTS